MKTLARTETVFLLLAGLTVAVLAVSGCHKDPTSSGHPEVINNPDSFHFRLGDGQDLDSTIVYYWQMGGTSANIDQSASIETGQVSVTIEDSTRSLVYQSDFHQNGSFTTSFGVAGFWRIRFSFRDFSGLVDFRVQRR
jgi:hypothetical protein